MRTIPIVIGTIVPNSIRASHTTDRPRKDTEMVDGRSEAEGFLPLSDLYFHILLPPGPGVSHGYADRQGHRTPFRRETQPGQGVSIEHSGVSIATGSSRRPTEEESSQVRTPAGSTSNFHTLREGALNLRQPDVGLVPLPLLWVGETLRPCSASQGDGKASATYLMPGGVRC